MVLVDGDAGGWRVDREALTSAIQAGWAGVEIDPARRSEACSFRWFFETEDGAGEAFLHEDETCLYMDLSQEDAARLAVVFRRLTPGVFDLVFCDQGYNFDVRLRSDASDDELISLIDAA
jgi:hypothetical protein